MQRHVQLVDLVKSFPTYIFLQNLASIQKRTSPLKFAHFAEKSEKGSISNLSTKAERAAEESRRAAQILKLPCHSCGKLFGLPGNAATGECPHCLVRPAKSDFDPAEKESSKVCQELDS